VANVLILSLVFPPDNVSTAQLMGEIALDLQQAGHTVRVISTVPHYNPESAPRDGPGLRRVFGPLVQRSEFGGIPVLHVWMPRKGGRIFLRVAAWGMFHLLSTILGVVSRWRPAVLLAPSPPLTIGLSAGVICWLRRTSYIYNIQEIYPDVAINLGVLKSPLLIRAMLAMEQQVYRRARLLTTISPSMRRKVIEKGVPEAKVRLVPNFVDLETFAAVPRDNAFARQHGLGGKFVVSYAGNVGKPQGLDVFVEAMDLLRDCPRIHLLMVGGGSEFGRLSARAQELNLPNTTFLPQQEYAVVPLIYGCSDLSVVAQAPGTQADGIPSKVYRIMGSGRAILACTAAESDLAWLVNAAGAGLVAQPETPAALAQLLRAAGERAGDWEAAGQRGREYVADHFSRSKITGQYAALIEEAASQEPAL
jgi:colanic acid biosynthesis glycosyl transferase WcaI